MKKLIYAFSILLAFSLIACEDKDNNPFEGTKWTNTTYVDGFTATLTFDDVVCNLSYIPTEGSGGIQFGANYTYTHSDNTASLTPLNEAAVSHRAQLSGSTLKLTNLTSQVEIIFTKQ